MGSFITIVPPPTNHQKFSKESNDVVTRLLNLLSQLILKEKKTILIVDDTETNIDILLGLLGNRYDVLVSLDGKSALEIVESEQVDLILLDVMMPNMVGCECCMI